MASSFRLSLACACAIAWAALALPSFAEPPAAGHGAWASSTPEQRAKLQTDLMKDKLALTAEQVPQVEAINLDSANKMQAAFTGSTGRAAKMRAAKQVQEDKEAALKKVLTPEQFEKFLAAREEFKQKAQEHAREKAAEPKP